MKTRMVIRTQAGSEKGHSSKAMKIAAETPGVESVTLAGKDRSLLVVVGDGVDCNDLTTKLRRKVGHADVVELRTLHDTGGGGYHHAPRADYGNGYGYPAASYTPSSESEYYSHRPSYDYYNHNHNPPPPYPATVVHHEYYPTGDPNSCSIM